MWPLVDHVQNEVYDITLFTQKNHLWVLIAQNEIDISFFNKKIHFYLLVYQNKVDDITLFISYSPVKTGNAKIKYQQP